MQALRALFIFSLLALWTAAGQAQTVNKDHLRASAAVIQAFRDVVAKPSQSVVRLQSNGKDAALGTIVDADGWIITKASDLTGKITCKLKDGREFEAKIVGVDEPYDLALVKIPAQGLQPVAWRSSKEAKVGKWVVSAGLGVDPVAIGVVSVGTRPYKPGDQGPKNSNTNAGWLGIGLEEANGGARVTGVFPNSPAHKAGLKANDIVFEAAGKKIIDAETLINTIQRIKPGVEVKLKVKRGEEELELRATLKKRPAELLGNPQENLGSKLSERRGGFPFILQHDTVLRPTDCGGPLVDLDGKTVGINIARAGRTETYAIPAEYVEKLLPELKSGKLAPKDDTTAKSEPALKLSEPLLQITRSLQKTDSFDKHRPGKQYMKVHEVKMTAGENYVIDMKSQEIDSYLLLENPAGKVVADDDDGPNARIIYRAPEDGTYRIIATSFGTEETGSYTLTVRKQLDAAKR
jgi:serine protease Do